MKRQIAWNKGKKLSSSHIENLRQAHYGQKPWNKSENYLVCPQCNKSFHTSPSNKRRFCSRTCKGIWMSTAYKGAGSPSWRGGITPEHRLIRASKAYKKWRDDVFKRDSYTCQRCSKVGGNLHAHHVLSFTDHPAFRFTLDNGLTFCVDCHYLAHKINEADTVYQA